MNDKVAYFIEMEPNMIKGVALYRLTFEPLNVNFDIADEQGQFIPVDESQWNELPHIRFVEVTEGIMDAWKAENPMGYGDVSKYVV